LPLKLTSSSIEKTCCDFAWSVVAAQLEWRSLISNRGSL